MGPTYQNMTNGTQLPEPDNWDPSDQWTLLLGKKEKLNSFRQKGHNPTIKKAAMLGLAHEADQKLIEKIYEKTELLGQAHVENRIGPG